MADNAWYIESLSKSKGVWVGVGVTVEVLVGVGVTEEGVAVLVTLGV